MTRRMRVIALVALCAAAPACTLIAGLTEDYRVVDGGVSPTGEGGGTDGSDSKDGALPDGFVPGTDGGDAKNDQVVPDGGPFSCGTETDWDFCEDFELGASAATTAVWTGIANSHAATIKVVDNAGLNEKSRGLDIDSMSSSTTSRNIYLHKTLPANKAISAYLEYDIDFDFKLISSLGNDYVAMGVLNFTNATPEDHGVAAYPGDDVIARLNPKTTGVSPATNKWHHVHIVLSHAAAGATFTRTMWIDSATTGVVDTGTSISTAGATITELRFGIFYTAGAAGEIHAVFDNIIARRK
jgi:hypothetical protein